MIALPTIRALTTAAPRFEYSGGEIFAVADKWLANHAQEREKFQRFVRASHIDRRSFALPMEKILALRGSAERANIFGAVGRELGVEVLTGACAAATREPGEINALIFTSCSVPAIPSIDAAIVNRAGLHPKVRRYPFFQFGCAGGASGLAFAAELASTGKRVALLSVELCSLLYHAEDLSGGNLVGSALFSDGAACALVELSEEGLGIVASSSHLIPESMDLMGYDIHDDGMHLRLDRELPSRLSAVAPTVVRDFLTEQGLTHNQISWWLFHPGGIKILQALERDFAINRSQSIWSWEVLEQFGNMSSASVLYVIDHFQRDRAAKPGDYGLVLGIGPGLTIETILFQMR